MDECNHYLVLKLGSNVNADFYEEHNKIIKKNGFVDYLVGCRKKPNFEQYNKTFFIKESKKLGGRTFCADILEVLENGEKYPDYYNSEIIKYGGAWIRIGNLRIINDNYLEDNFHTKTGKTILSVYRSSVPFFGVIKN